MDDTSRAADRGFDPERLQRIQDWMQRYVDDGKLPFAATVISRHDEVAWHGFTGLSDVENAKPYTLDTIVRMFSMTKPVTAVALMMLYEQGLFSLDDPVEAFLPEFSDLRVVAQGRKEPGRHPKTQTKAGRSIICSPTPQACRMGSMAGRWARRRLRRIWTLHPVPAGWRPASSACRVCRCSSIPANAGITRWPAMFWAGVIEVISGEPLDEYFRKRIFEPLGMKDTGFDVPDNEISRLASLYETDGKGGMTLKDAAEASCYRAGRVDTFSGGGGLVSTARDFLIFAEMLRLGGRFDDVRLLSSRTLNFMTGNHLSGDIATMGPDTWCETSFHGIGFGLGFWVMLDPPTAQMPGSVGDFGWGGLASTVFWVDPVEDMTVLYLTQLMPSSTYPLRKELRALVYQALVD